MLLQLPNFFKIIFSRIEVVIYIIRMFWKVILFFSNKELNNIFSLQLTHKLTTNTLRLFIKKKKTCMVLHSNFCLAPYKIKKSQKQYFRQIKFFTFVKVKIAARVRKKLFHVYLLKTMNKIKNNVTVEMNSRQEF